MISLELETGDAAKDILIAELWEEGSAGVTEIELGGGRWRLVAFFESQAEAARLLRRFAAHAPQVTVHESRDWVAESRSQWQPLAVGERFYLVPDWRDDPAPPGRLRIAINPGLACGTGYHEATQLCLEAIERRVGPGTAALDVGCGAGILSIACALLGASRVVACDVDPMAVEIAAAAFARAGVRAMPLVGSAGAIRSGSASLIVANISAAVCVDLAGELLRCLASGGRAVVSGFEEFESADVEIAIQRAGGAVVQKSTKGSWRALTVTG